MAFFQYDRCTQFAESDAAGIIHFSRIACYVEEAEHCFLKTAGFPVEIHDPEALRWPRLHFKAAFAHPILPLQEIRVVLTPVYVGKSSVNWKWSILLREGEDVLCEGEMKTVCCKLRKGRMQTCQLPDDLRTRLFTP